MTTYDAAEALGLDLIGRCTIDGIEYVVYSDGTYQSAILAEYWDDVPAEYIRANYINWCSEHAPCETDPALLGRIAAVVGVPHLFDGAGYIDATMDTEPKDHIVDRDGERPISFSGWLIGIGEMVGRRRDNQRVAGLYTAVRIYLSVGGCIITSVRQVDAGRHRCARAAAHDTPQEALDWLVADAGDKLGPASKEAWEAAGERYAPIGELATERVP